MFSKDDKLSNAERAVQRKVRDGQRLNNEDKRTVQTRLRALQRQHLQGLTGGIPSGAEAIVAMPNVQPAVSAISATCRSMAGGGYPNVGSKAPELERQIRQINASQTTASFSFTLHGSLMSVPTEWRISGSFSLGPLQYVSGTAGTGGGTTTVGGGGASGNTQSSGGSVGVGGGQGSGVSASVPVSGATVGGGQSNSGGASGGISGGGSASTGQSGGGTATQGSSGGNLRETYMAPITCAYDIEAELTMGWSPISWVANTLDEFGGPKTGSGSASNCGMIQFTIAGA